MLQTIEVELHVKYVTYQQLAAIVQLLGMQNEKSRETFRFHGFPIAITSPVNDRDNQTESGNRLHLVYPFGKTGDFTRCSSFVNGTF